MKKILFIVIALFFTFTQSKSLDLSDLCDGVYHKINIAIDNCPYNVDICVNCTVGPSTDGMIEILGFSKADPNCPTFLDANQVLSKIKTEMLDYNRIHDLCKEVLFPPCPSAITFVISYTQCWTKLLEGGKIWYMPCMDEELSYQPWCNAKYNLCWESGVLTKTLVETSKSGNWDAYPTGNEPPDPIIEGTYSDCFRLWTPCDD